MTFVTDEIMLRKPCDPVTSIREGREIAHRLQAALSRHNKRAKRPMSLAAFKSGERRWFGLGLAAPQLGIHKRVCVLDYGTPVVLMNPEIVAYSANKFPAEEGCLSLPGEKFDTYRYFWVSVKTLNLPGLTTFGGKTPEESTPRAMLRSVVAQHEIAHCYGLLATDFSTPGYPPPEEWETWRP